jgi:hypothetical protein
VTADGYWWPLSLFVPASRIDAFAGLQLKVLDANGQVTVPPGQGSQWQDVVHLLAWGEWTESTIVGQDISRGYVLQYEDLFVPANGTLEAYLTCHINWLAYEGGGYFIAAGNGLKLSGFGLFIATQTPKNVAASPPAHS